MSTAFSREQTRIQNELDRCQSQSEKLKTIEDIMARPVEVAGIREWIRSLYLNLTEPA